MNFHILILFIGSLVSICSLVSVFYVPWIHVKAPISKGFYDIHVFLDIGLFQCFSDICRKYTEVEYFLEVKLPRYIDQTYPNISTSSTDILLGTQYLEQPSPADVLQQGIKLPKLPNIIALEKASLEKFIGHFKLVSKIVIFNLFVAIMLLLIFFLLFCYDLYLFHMVVLFPKLYDVLLLAVVFFYTVAVLTYIYMTLSLIDGGRYSAGVWISGYTCIFGLICCFLAPMCPGWHTRAQLITNEVFPYSPVNELSPIASLSATTTPLRQTPMSYGSHNSSVASRLWKKSGDVERGRPHCPHRGGFTTSEIELSPTTAGGDSRFLLVTS